METNISLNSQALIYLFLCAILSSCGSSSKRIEEDVEQLYSSSINIPIHQMLRFDSHSSVPEVMRSMGFKMVVFTDSTECSSCAIGHLNAWEPILDSLMTFPEYNETVFIFAPSKTDCSKVEKELRYSDFKYPVYLDTCNIFAEVNNIPINRMMHTFLIDKESRVILVGNPLSNPKIQELLFKVLNSERIEDASQ